jgi:uncharacterized protein involved in exopolysaccharide biosynthesis
MTKVQRTIAKVTDAYQMLWNHRILVAIVFAISLAIGIAFVNSVPRQYAAAASVLVVNGNTRDDPSLASPDLPSIIGSTTLLERVKQHLGLNMSLIELKRRLTVKSPAYKSSIIRIEYVDSDPTRAALVPNDIADQLTMYYREMLTGRFDSQLRALGTEIDKQSARIRSLDRQLQEKGDLAAGSMDASGADLLGTRLTNLETELQLANASLQGDESGAQAVQLDGQTQAKILRHDVLQNDDEYRGLVGSALASNVELQNVRSVYTQKYPGLPALETKTRKLNAAVNSEAARVLHSPDAYSPSLLAAVTEQRKAEAVVQADAAKVAALQSLVAQEHGRLAALPPLALLRLQRSAAQSDYLSMSGHRAMALSNRADALSLGSVIVTDRALAVERQAGLGHRSMAIVLALLSLALAVGAAFLAEGFNPRLRRVSHIEDLYGQPVVATLGKMQ